MNSVPNLPPPVESLYKLGGAYLVAEVAGIALAQCEERMAEAAECRQAEDWPAVATQAHGIRSSAGVLGATELYEAASRLEQAIKTEPGGSYAALFEELRSVFDATAETWRQWCQVDSDGPSAETSSPPASL